MQQKKDDYYLGLIYCTRNDIDNAYFYLNRAANAGHELAKQTLKEMEEKNLLRFLKTPTPPRQTDTPD